MSINYDLVDKECEHCGELMYGVKKIRKYHSECWKVLRRTRTKFTGDPLPRCSSCKLEKDCRHVVMVQGDDPYCWPVPDENGVPTNKRHHIWQAYNAERTGESV